MKKYLAVLCLLALSVGFVPTNVAFAHPEFVMRDLGYGEGHSINDNGEITGCAPDPVTGQDKAYFWSEETGMVFSDMTGCGRDINNIGQVIRDGVIWGRDGSYTNLTYPENNGIASTSINDSGVVVGWLRRITPGYDAILWPTSTTYILMDSLGGQASWANSINNNGQIVGESNDGTSAWAAIWDLQGNATKIPTFTNSYSSAAFRNNNLGQVVGEYRTPDFYHGFLYTPGVGLSDLGTIGGTRSEAIGINDNGWVVGRSSYISTSSIRHAFVWNPTDGMIDLNLSDAVSSGAMNINSHNQIVGGFEDSAGKSHIALWEPVSTNYSVGGTANLQDFTGDKTSVSLSVELRNHNGNTTTSNINISGDGSFQLPSVPQGYYDISFKADHWLRKTVTNVAVFANTTGISVSLINGDIDGDNNIDKQDQDLFKKAFGSVPNSRKWNANADLNGDDKINRLDKAILEKNLGLSGNL